MERVAARHDELRDDIRQSQVAKVKAGLDLRHTYATRLRRAGCDPAQIQALLGHALLDTTAQYVRASTTELADVFDGRDD